MRIQIDDGAEGEGEKVKLQMGKEIDELMKKKVKRKSQGLKEIGGRAVKCLKAANFPC